MSDPITSILLWPSRLKNVFKGTQDCVYVIDQSNDGEDGPTIAVVRTMDEAKIVAKALAPVATIYAVAR